MLDLRVVTALLAGGVVAAPVAAALVRFVPARMLGAAVGGVIVLTNSRTILRAADLEAGWGQVAYPALLALWVAAVLLSARTYRAERAAPAVAGPGQSPVGAVEDDDVLDPA